MSAWERPESVLLLLADLQSTQWFDSAGNEHGVSIRMSIRTAGDRTGDVYELTDEAETVRAEVWPQWGFNCLRWQVRDRSGRLGRHPLFGSRLGHLTRSRRGAATRSSSPFPADFARAHSHSRERSLVLPLNDSTGKHAIHGFTPRNRWRVADAVADSHSASVTGEFNLTQDLPDALPYWPADFRLAVTYSLYHDRLRVDARVENLGPGSLPFGLGYHPYFQLPGVSDPDLGRYTLRVSAGEVWESVEHFRPVLACRFPRASTSANRSQSPTTHLDHVFTGARTETDSLRDMNDLAEC